MTQQLHKTIAVVNATGRQAASLIRVASALGYGVRAHTHTLKGVIAEELASLPNVTLLRGDLMNNPTFMDEIFKGTQLAFINTVSQAGDEVAIGRALADAAKRAGTIQHFIYSSMPDHSVHGPWPGPPMWACKFTVENYVRQLGIPATFVYAGIYNNNFTSLPYPLFQMELQPDGSFEWAAPFNPDVPLPWIALTFETLSPIQVCAAFARALGRRVKYRRTSKIEIKVRIPDGYREQLEALEELFGQHEAPYFPQPEFNTPAAGSPKGLGPAGGKGAGAGMMQGPGGVVSQRVTDEARKLWQGWRDMEEYAREVFPVEEEANGLQWML
ncbi:hypothetical protein ZTR_02418 [Talaromyces verruculosus]|nr:hypothetical protein ZTR_02418 [Talaromyces verruculosus]